MTGLLNPDEMAARYQELAALIGPCVTEEDGVQPFEAAVEQLTGITHGRYQVAVDFPANQ